MKHLIICILGPVILATASVAQETVLIRGGVQLWQRACTTVDRCEGSLVVSERMPIAATLVRPASDQELSVYKDEFVFHNTKLVFQTFWRLGSEAVTGHLTHQISLSLQNENQADLPLSRCTIYQPVKDPTFPVGACTSFQVQDHELVQYGVTLWKSSTVP